MSTTADRTTELLPRWDMTRFFPGLDSAELEAETAGILAAIDDLRDLFDRLGVRKPDRLPDDPPVEAFEEVTRRREELRERVRTLMSYLGCHVATDATNDLAQARLSELQTRLVELTKLGTRYDAWVRSLDADALARSSPVARDHRFALERAREAARHQMSEPEEDLAASLQPSAQAAWAKLHGNVTSRLVVRVPLPDSDAVELPMSAVRGLLHDPDPAVRRAAYEAEIASWEQVSVPIAAALNGVKGTVTVLNGRRGWADSLEPVLFANNVDRSTVEAMQEACTAAFGDFHRYFRAKARLLGTDALAWHDLVAPVGGGAASRHWPFDEAAAFVVEQFGTFSGRMADLAARAFRESWVDAEPRVGKRDGAFCSPIRGDESRVMLNYEPSFGSVSTLAHELGHAYHNLNLSDRTPTQRETPMALAETASIFCETIVTNAMLRDASGAEKLAILEGELQRTSQVVVDIHSRFLFERAVFDARSRRELSVDELCAEMTRAQRATYGDAVDPLHRYMWAMKPHYYSSSYYNWPYTFGLLFGLGLYARYVADPDGFRTGYDELLSSTGLAPAAELADRFGIDVRSADFWRSSLDTIRARIDEFEALAG